MSSNYYEVLGVSKESGDAEIKKAYKKQALKNHPDKAKTPRDKELATPRFQKIAEAYECLIDPQKRAEYDAVLDGVGGATMGGSMGGMWEQGSNSKRGAGGMKGFGGGGFDDAAFEAFHQRMHEQTRTDPFELFNSFFGDVGFGVRRRSNRGGGRLGVVRDLRPS